MFCGSADAFTYNLVDDWSNLNNPNGPWSYNEGNNPLPYNVDNWPATEFGISQTAWAYTSSGADYHFLPGWFKSIGDPNLLSTNPFHSNYDWLEGDVVVHTTDGEINGIANVTWKNPMAGIYDVNGGIWIGRENNKSEDWNLYLNDVLLASGKVFAGDSFSRSNPNSFNIQGINISEGSMLKLELFKTLGSDGGDFVGVNLNIDSNSTPTNAVPEPATILLLGIGLTGVLVRKYRV